MRYLFFSLLAVMTMLLFSCIDGQEEVFIHSDGSTRITVRYEVPQVLLSDADAAELKAMIDRSLGAAEHVRLIENSSDLVRGKRVILVEVESDSDADFDQLIESTSFADSKGEGKSATMLKSLVGDLNVSVRGLSVDFSRDVNLDPLLEKYLGKNGASLLGDSEFRYIVHLPKASEENNAHRVEDDGKTLIWNYKLSECKRRPIAMSMVAPIPLPWMTYLAPVLLGGLVGGLFIWRKRKK